MDKGAMYQLMNQQLEGLLKATPYRISGLANASALLWETLRDINWAGFYLIEDGQLICKSYHLYFPWSSSQMFNSSTFSLHPCTGLSGVRRRIMESFPKER